MALWNNFPIISYGILIPVIAFFLQIIYRRLKNPLNAVPGPSIAKWTNLRLKMAVISGQRIHYIHDLHGRYGPFVRISPTEISVSDPESFSEIHRIGSGFHKTAWYAEFAKWERTGLFTLTDPKECASRRRLLARGFSKTYLRQFWEPFIHEKIRTTVSKMIEESKTTGKTDILKWWMFMSSDVSMHLMFGDSFNSVEKGKKSDFTEALEMSNMEGGIGAELPIITAIGRQLPFEACKRIFGATNLLWKEADVAVTNARAGSDKNLFARIVSESDKGESLDDVDVKVEAVSFIIAGSDTTAVSLTYLVWAVLSNPEVARVLCSELKALSETYSDGDLEELPILNAVIEETLRLYGAAPGGLPRAVPAEGAQMGGYFFPAGTTVTTQAYTIHRNGDLFPNPDKFDYKRWLPESDLSVSNAKQSSSNADMAKTAFHPFGGASRSCLGVNLARSELRLGVAEFFRRIPTAKLARTTTPESMEMENYFLIAPKSHRCEIVI